MTRSNGVISLMRPTVSRASSYSSRSMRQRADILTMESSCSMPFRMERALEGYSRPRRAPDIWTRSLRSSGRLSMSRRSISFEAPGSLTTFSRERHFTLVMGSSSALARARTLSPIIGLPWDISLLMSSKAACVSMLWFKQSDRYKGWVDSLRMRTSLSLSRNRNIIRFRLLDVHDDKVPQSHEALR